ncbi:MAG: RNA polymerase sigma factor [Myxococcota bacterium]
MMRSTALMPAEPGEPRGREHLETWCRNDRERTLALIYQLTGASRPTCEDILQDVTLRAHQSLERFRGDASFRTWVTTIVLRECHRHRRRQALWRATRHFLAPIFEREAQGDSLLRRRLGRALDRLSPAQRNVFVLVHLQEMTLEDAARTLGCAPGTAKSHLHRALEKLRRSLRASYGEIP